MHVCTPDPSGVVLCNPFKWDILWFISIKNLVVFVPTTIIAKRFLFLNHRNRKGVGGKHNTLVHYVNVCAPDPACAAQWNPFRWDFFWLKILLFCAVPGTTAKKTFSLNHRKRKGVTGKHNVLVDYVNVCAPDLAGVILWNAFKWDFLQFILTENHVVCVPAITL